MKNTTAVTSPATTAVSDAQEPLRLRKRIGSTTYLVAVRFSDQKTETLEDKLLRIIEREVAANAS